MKVLYDASDLLTPSGAVKNYHDSLLRELIPRIWPHEIELFPYLDEQLPMLSNKSSNYPFLKTRRKLAGIWAANRLGYRYADRAARGVEIFHVTQRLRDPPSGPMLTSMIHDVTPATMPEYHTRAEIADFEHFVVKTIPRLTGLIVPSNVVKTQVVEAYGADEEKTIVIPYGVGEDFFGATAAQRQVAAETYSLPNRFVLWTGTIEPRKNFELLMEGYSMLPERTQMLHPLVIIGPYGREYQKCLKLIEKNRYAMVVGYVKRELLPAIYESASAFLCTSLYEGFGLPLLEAMAAGVPAIAVNSGALPEVAGDCALLVEPDDPREVSEALRVVLQDRGAALAMGSRGRQRARQFSWELCAAEIKDYFAELAGESL